MIALTVWPWHVCRAKQVLALIQLSLLHWRCLAVALLVTAKELLYSAFLLDDLPVNLWLGRLCSRLLGQCCLLLHHGPAPQGT